MSIFSAKNSRKAQQATMELLANAQNQAFGMLDQAQQQGMQYLNQNTDIFNSGYANANNALQGAYNTSNNWLNNSRNYYSPYADMGNQAVNAYQDAMGFNGADGSARANAAFRATPGYQFALDQGLDAVNRSAATRGMASSGNTAVELAKYASGFADQTYGNYMNRLQNGMQQGFGAAQGLAGIDQGLANNATNYGASQSNLSMQHAGNLAGVNTGLSNLSQGSANTKAQMLMDVANKNADAVQAAYKAADQANANRFGAIMGGLKLGGGLLGFF